MSTAAVRVAGELDEIRELAHPLDTTADLDELVEHAGRARYVLLGEASHGTAEYYGWRAAITRRLIAQHGFSFVAVEGDWPDCFRINRWVKDAADGASALDVLGRFERWPRWMWANDEVADFIAWLQVHNRRQGGNVGFYGLDVYSLWDSLRGVLGYLEAEMPEAVEAAHRAFACFEPFAEDPQRYAFGTRMVPASCEDEVLELLTTLRRAARDGADGGDDAEAELDARQNAEVIAGAEAYYRTMLEAGAGSWNLRDHHMADTLDRLMEHHGEGARAIVWAHNSHVGDARATDMAAAGMTNLGQLARERHDDVFLVGFLGHRGTVIAGDHWGGPARRMLVPASPAGTHEDLFHQACGRPVVAVLPAERTSPWLSAWRGHRAIGVVYHPSAERRGNWVPTRLGGRYDAVISLDETRALRPLDAEPPATGTEQATAPWAS